MYILEAENFKSLRKKVLLMISFLSRDHKASCVLAVTLLISYFLHHPVLSFYFFLANHVMIHVFVSFMEVTAIKESKFLLRDVYIS